MQIQHCMNEREIKKAKQEMDFVLNSQNSEYKATTFKILGDLNRIKIVELLIRYQQLCVNDISQLIDASIATISSSYYAEKSRHHYIS